MNRDYSLAATPAIKNSFIDDDGKDYTAVIIAKMRGVHGLMTVPQSAPVTPVVVNKLKAHDPSERNASIGFRNQYSRNIMMAIYQLDRQFYSSGEIAARFGMPQACVKRVLMAKTQQQQQLLSRVNQMSAEALPDIDTAVARMNCEPKITKTISKRGTPK